MNTNYTVIINVRNGEKYLIRAIDQISQQTIRPSKVIIFNNASHDNTSKLIKKIISKNPKLYIYKRSQKILTLYKARNLALNFAKTKYVCFLDVDDLWNKKKSEKQLVLLTQNKNAIACLTQYKKVLEHRFNHFEFPNSVCDIDHAIESNFYSFIKKYNIHFSSIMFNRINLLNTLGKNPFNPRLTILGDIDLFLRIFGLRKVILLKENMSSYIFHDSNTGYINYYRITFESLIVAFKLLSKAKILKAAYIIYTYNIKYFTFIISKLKSNNKRC